MDGKSWYRQKRGTIRRSLDPLLLAHVISAHMKERGEGHASERGSSQLDYMYIRHHSKVQKMHMHMYIHSCTGVEIVMSISQFVM